MTALPQRDNTTEPDATRDARPDALAEDLTTARRSLITKLVTPGSTVATIASALAAYFIVRAETHLPVRQDASMTREQAEALVADVRDLKLTVGRIEQKVNQFDGWKTGLDQSLAAFRLGQQNAEFRMQGIERDINRLQSRRE